MKQVRINITTRVNSSKIRHEKRNGRDVVIVPSATLPDDVVMNGIRYPADEIEKSYSTLERTPAPFGHPTINGEFVSASDPEGINLGWIGAWNENVRRANGRVFLDKVIDVSVAKSSVNGKRVLEAIDKNEPIHTSTGLLANLIEIENDDSCDAEARDIIFDHDAILLDEEGAATPEQGVGMLVNGKKVDVINSYLEETLDNELDWTLDSIVRTFEKRQRVPMIERLKSALVEFFATESELANHKETDDMADDKTGAALEARIKTMESSVVDIKTSVDKIGETMVNAIKEALTPLTDQVNQLTNSQKAQAEARKAALVNTVVEAGVLSKAAAETLSEEALAELADGVKPKEKAAGLNSRYTPPSDNVAAFQLPKAEGK